MAHYRQVLREAIAATVSGLPTTGASVLSGRGKPLPQSRLPALRIRPVAEASERHAGGKPSGENPIMRTLEIGITAMAAGDDFDDVLDRIAEEVETVIGADPTLGGMVLDCILSRTEFDEYSAGDKPSGTTTLIYRIRYRTAINAPHSAA